MLAKFPLHVRIVGEQAKKEFIALFGSILRLQNILTCFDEFEGNELLSVRDNQDYRSLYLDIYADYRSAKSADKERILDDIVFEIELIKQVEINVDYILMLVAKYREAKGNGNDVEIRAQITRAIDSSPTLRNKKDLIENFVDSVSAKGEIDAEWRSFVAEQRQIELDRLIDEEALKPEETRLFLAEAFRDGALRTSGTAITNVMPPISRFSPDGGHGDKKQRVLIKLIAYFERFFGLVSRD